MNKERLAEIGKLLLQRADAVAIALLAVLLGLGLYLNNRESNWRPPPVEIQAARQINDQMPEAAVELVEETFGARNVDIMADAEASRLVQFNMFERRDLNEQEQLEQAIARDFVRAESLFREEDYDGARQILQSILARNPQHVASMELQQRIDVAEAEGGGA